MKNEETAKKVENLIAREVSMMGLDLVEVTYGGGALRVTIDRPPGVTVEDCAAVSRRVGMLLDVEDVIAEHYKLEVSSPGLTRKLTRANDFERFAGKPVKVITPTNVYKGMLKGLVGEVVLLDIEGKSVSVKMQDIVKANLEVDF